jgi:hypothetical protein
VSDDAVEGLYAKTIDETSDEVNEGFKAQMNDETSEDLSDESYSEEGGGVYGRSPFSKERRMLNKSSIKSWHSMIARSKQKRK